MIWKSVANAKKKILLLLKRLHENCSSRKFSSCRKLNDSSEMRDDVLIHREGLMG